MEHLLMECVKIRRLLFLLIVVINCVESLNNSGSDSALPLVPSLTEELSEQELSSQLQDVGTRSGGWSSWSEWSPCSRSCDGGVSHQIRTCNTASCRGENIRHKICNMQACPEPRDFREDQCSSFNSKPFKNIMYEWFAHYDEENPCVLFCKGKLAEEDSDEDTSEEPVMTITKLADKVHDGTRCRHGSLDMCIDGICHVVGCDLQVGSMKQVDACGICGGDGSSCARPLYHWNLAPMSLCSVTCGGGYKMSRPVCQNRISGEEVDEQLCNDSQKPDSTVIPCNNHNCPARWHAGDWGPCTVTCGGGSRVRQVYCVEEANNTKIKVNEMKCFGLKPRFQESCNQFECPTWHSSSWSGCSVSCGEGVQIRLVECRDDKEKLSTKCDPLLKPTDTKPCSTGIQCPFSGDSGEDFSVLPYHQPLIQPYPPPPLPEKLVGDAIVPSETTFVPDQWGPCSVSCGEGVRKREVHCKIFLEFSRTIAKLPDHKCGTPKPIEIEKCYMGPCTAEKIGMEIAVDTIKDDPYREFKVAGGSPGKTYAWKEQGYTHCSATCLGGMQELIVNCIREDTGKVTSPYLCPMETKPEILKRICNDIPCPPKWNYSEFSPCTQNCGLGLQTREVNCIHEVTQGGRNTIVVPNNNCPQPPPPDRQYCNVLDCPVRWVVSEWSRCTKSCDGGEKNRKVECKQTMAQNHTVSRPQNMCPSPKPPEKKPCNTKSCVIETDKPKIFASNNTFIQHNIKQKKISLTVGGAATVFLGTTVKVKCPVKRFDRSKIAWLKDKIPLPKSKKFKTSKKGALRIQNLSLRESGSYTCIAGKSSANIQISVRPKPGEFPTSEEIQKGYKHRNDLLPNVNHNRDEMVFNSDDQSHEQRPDGQKKKSSKPKLFTPTLPSLTLDKNQLNALPPQSTSSQNTENNEQDRLLSSSSESLKPAGGSSSSGSRPMPHFQSLVYNLQLLWPFQMFGNSRGHRMISTSEEYFPRDVANADQLFSTTPFEEDPGREIVLGKGAEDMTFDWVLGPWSPCSEPCGFNGVQTRDAKCMVKLHNTTQEVNSHLCDDANLIPPDTLRQCNRHGCPRWKVEAWSDCSKSKCISLHKAIQRRVVKCYSWDNLVLGPSKCDKTSKPNQQQECFNNRCVGKWRAGPWSECAAGCEMHGVKYRILQCVWFGTKKPAGTACKDIPRPPVMKPCVGPSCSNSVTDCKDHSTFCPNVKAMSMCNVSWYTQQCCESCKN
ncbi:protein madd-4 isoform X3 [Harmonia axyridis]|uniref:protein madd-4 isoform X3 n=1 Tax=Harmonia axyridis TaxID=115357 RepID=UPI001E277EE4|nr:protein madd-4 isoform X3 [Harmonia axyridis]